MPAIPTVLWAQRSDKLYVTLDVQVGAAGSAFPAGTPFLIFTAADLCACLHRRTGTFSALSSGNLHNGPCSPDPCPHPCCLQPRCAGGTLIARSGCQGREAGPD